MKKVLFRGVILISFFLITWIALAQINWMNVFGIEEFTRKLDNKLGEIFSDYIMESENVIDDVDINYAINTITDEICRMNAIESRDLKVYVIKKDEVNAFALPGNQLVVYTGLINECKNQYELSGVIAHELAHLQLGHIKKKLVKEVGLSALLSISGGGSGQMLKKTVKVLSSSAYDRELEKEADLKAIVYMKNTVINPSYLADFLERLSSKSSSPEYFSWISNHPNTSDRVSYIRDKNNNYLKESREILEQDEWNSLKESIKDLD